MLKNAIFKTIEKAVNCMNKIEKIRMEGKVEPFPKTNDVFTEDFEKSSTVFFPVCSINLSAVNKAWPNEKIHLVNYNEDPYNVDCAKHFNEYCTDRMVGFDVIDGKFKFKTDFGYFDRREEWEEWFDKTVKSFNVAKDMFNKTGEFPFPDIGGVPDWWQNDDTPKDPDGTSMTFIASFDTGEMFNDYCDKRIYLFYSFKHKLAVQIYQID